jgi:hypothetical protein
MPLYSVIDREAYHERCAILLDAAEADGTLETMGHIWCYQQAGAEISRIPFSVAATAMANGDPEPAKQLCRREQERHGRQWAVELWKEIERVVAEAHELG